MAQRYKTCRECGRSDPPRLMRGPYCRSCYERRNQPGKYPVRQYLPYNLVYRDSRRKRGSGITANQWEKIKYRFDYRCAACGEEKPLTRDHIIPLSRGGSDSVNNIQPLCFRCNNLKGDMMPEEFEARYMDCL